MSRIDLDSLLDDLKAQLAVHYGRRLHSVVLFGSQARGDAGDDSDVDVLVLLHGAANPYDEIAATRTLLSEIWLKHDCIVSCLFRSVESLEPPLGPFLGNVVREGIVV